MNDNHDEHGRFASGQSGTHARMDSLTNAAHARGTPIADHPYHQKSDAELHYIAKDAGEAAKAMQGHSPQAENKYLDQHNNAATVLHYRRTGGSWRG